MTKATSSKPSSPQFELNALALLRVGGLARALLENKDNPAEVERIANDLLALEPHSVSYTHLTLPTIYSV